MSLTTGTRIGPYEITGLLGAGGMGEVYKARDTRLGRVVAIKVLADRIAADPELKQRFEREAKALAALSHPHICPVFDVGRQDTIDFLVMEYLEGETLEQRLAKGALPLTQALRYATEIADALDKAHRQGIVHRDLKPGNIMITKGGTKLLDFGLAKLHHASDVREPAVSAAATVGSPLTGSGSIIGTFQYMAPEQLEGQEADARTDIFAFGVVLYEMVTGRKAFHGKSHASLMAAILTAEPPAPSTLEPMTPRTIDRVVKTCLEKDPADRWQSSRDLLRELQWAATEQTESAAPPVSPQIISRRHWLAALGGVAALVLIVVMWLSPLGGAAPTGPPVIVLMDSTHPERIYDDATRAAGGTNADDLTNVLRDLPVVLVKENTNPTWNREDEILRQNPDLIVAHRSSFFDATFGGSKEFGPLTFSLAWDKFDVFMGYVGQGNPRTRFLVYSRAGWQNNSDDRQRWVASVEARFPTLRSRVTAWQVPLDRPTFRHPMTGAEIRKQVEALLDLGSQDLARR